MAKIRVHKKDNFTIIDNGIFKNKELSLKAVGLYCKIFSLPPEWDFSLCGLVAICKEGKDAVNAAIKELENAEYLTRTRNRDENGRYLTTIRDINGEICQEGQTWDIYETPEQKREDDKRKEQLNQQQPNTTAEYGEKRGTVETTVINDITPDETPKAENPHMDKTAGQNQKRENPLSEKPTFGKPALNKELTSYKEKRTINNNSEREDAKFEVATQCAPNLVVDDVVGNFDMKGSDGEYDKLKKQIHELAALGANYNTEDEATVMKNLKEAYQYGDSLELLKACLNDALLEADKDGRAKHYYPTLRNFTNPGNTQGYTFYKLRRQRQEQHCSSASAQEFTDKEKQFYYNEVKACADFEARMERLLVDNSEEARTLYTTANDPDTTTIEAREAWWRYRNVNRKTAKALYIKKYYKAENQLIAR